MCLTHVPTERWEVGTSITRNSWTSLLYKVANTETLSVSEAEGLFPPCAHIHLHTLAHTIHTYLVRVTIVVLKLHGPKATWRGKGFIWLTRPHHSLN